MRCPAGCHGCLGDTAERHRDSRAVLELLGYEQGRVKLDRRCAVRRLENARSAREALSAEIWECLNSTYNSLPTRVWWPPATSAPRRSSPTSVNARLRVAGYGEASTSRTRVMTLVLGRSLERVDMTARAGARGPTRRRRGSEGLDLHLRAARPLMLPAYSPAGRRGSPGGGVSLGGPALPPVGLAGALSSRERARCPADPASGRSGLNEPARRAIGRARTDLEFLSAANLLDGLPDRRSDCSGPYRRSARR